MTASPVSVYRSRDPQILAAHDLAVVAVERWIETVRALARSITGRDEVIWSADLTGDHLEGLYLPPGVPIPDGWERSGTRADMIVPDCVTAVGRDAANRVRPLRTAPNVREVLPGMPASISVASPTAGGGTRHHNALLRTEDHLDAIWPVEVPAELVGPGWRRVDLDRWHTELDEREANLG